MKLEVRGLSQGYGKTTVLNSIDFDAESGEVLTILGPNGSGKSTMIKTICGILDRRAGSIMIDGKEMQEYDRQELAKKVAYVPQKNEFFGYSTVYDAVLIGRKPHVKWAYSSKDIRIASEAMVAMKIDSLYDAQVQNLSGGQMQRVTLARAITQDPELYVFDEPTSALDLRNQLDSLKLMRDIIKSKNCCMIIALHDLNLAIRFSDKVLVIKNGDVYAFGTAKEVITEKMISDVYGVKATLVETEDGPFIHALDSESD